MPKSGEATEITKHYHDGNGELNRILQAGVGGYVALGRFFRKRFVIVSMTGPYDHKHGDNYEVPAYNVKFRPL